MPFFHLITLISNAHLFSVLAARAIGCFRPSCDGLPQQIASRGSSGSVRCMGFSSLALGSPRHAGTIDAAAASAFCPEEAVDRNGHLFLERPVFIEISPARSVAVKRLPAPCRGVVPKPGTDMHDCTNVPSPVTNQAYPFFTMSETTSYAEVCVFFVHECLQRVRQFAARRGKNGGAYRDRTDDILLAKQALSQLS